MDIQPFAYRIPEAAKFSGTSRSTIYRLIADRQITPLKVRGRTLILREDLEAYVRSLREVAA